MADPSEMLIHSNQSFPEGYFCCNPSLFISQPAKAPDNFRAVTNGKTAVVAAIFPAPEANPMAVSKGIIKQLPELSRNLPDSLSMDVLYDATVSINASIHEVIHTLLEAVVIVLVVISVFVSALRAVIIPVIAIPLSLLGVLALLQLAGFSLNLITLLAMVLAIGLVVDDAIVVLENIHRRIGLGESPLRAAVLGSREVAFPVIAMTLTLLAVYLPVAFMDGVTGALFKEFALTLAGAVLISGIIALTLTPVMCANLLNPAASPQVTPNPLLALIQQQLGKLQQRYVRSLTAIMQHRAVVIGLAVSALLSIPTLLYFIPSEMAPVEDTGLIMIGGAAPWSANLDYIQHHASMADQIIQSQEGVAHAQIFSGAMAPNEAFGLISLAPPDQRKVSQTDVVNRIASALDEIPGMAMMAFENSDFPGATGGLPVQFIISTPESFNKLFDVATGVLEAAQNSGLFSHVELDLQFNTASMTVDIDKDKAGAYGVTMAAIGETLSTMMSDSSINHVSISGRSYEVIPQVQRKDRQTPESIGHYYVRSSHGVLIPLSSLVTVNTQPSLPSLPHFNQLHAATLGAVAANGVSMGEAVQPKILS